MFHHKLIIHIKENLNSNKSKEEINSLKNLVEQLNRESNEKDEKLKLMKVILNLKNINS
jgi:hypothetical protein